MNELNVYNLPEDMLYQYSTRGEYIIKLKRNSTRIGNFASKEPKLFTEVYVMVESGELKCAWSGLLINDPSAYGKSGSYGENIFGIYDYDMDAVANFEVNMPLTFRPELEEYLDLKNESRSM